MSRTPSDAALLPTSATQKARSRRLSLPAQATSSQQRERGWWRVASSSGGGPASRCTTSPLANPRDGPDAHGHRYRRASDGDTLHPSRPATSREVSTGRVSFQRSSAGNANTAPGARPSERIRAQRAARRAIALLSGGSAPGGVLPGQDTLSFTAFYHIMREKFPEVSPKP